MPRRPHRNAWTEEQDRQLKRLQSEKLSANEIASALQAIRPGMDRNAIIGRLHRLGLPLLSRAKTGRPKAPAARSERIIAIRTRTAPTPHKPVSQLPDVPHNPVSLFDAKLGQCRWPLNDKEPIDEFRFCGGTTVEGSSWCAGHARMAYT